MVESKKWHRAAIRISSKTLSAEEISDILNVEADKMYEKGTPVNPRKPESLIRDISQCDYDSVIPREEEFSEHLRDLIGFIEENLEQLKELQSTCEIDLFCGLFSESEGGDLFKIDAELIRRLAIFPIDIEIHLYPPLLPGNQDLEPV